MPAPRSSGEKINNSTIKIVVAVIALVSAGGLLAWNLGLFGGNAVSMTAAQKAADEQLRKDAEAAAKERGDKPKDPNRKPIDAKSNS